MKLTAQIARTFTGEFQASFAEMPSIFYVAPTEKVAAERLERLAHALESPNIRVDRILPNGEVVLVLDRREGGEEEESDDAYPRFVNSVFQAVA